VVFLDVVESTHPVHYAARPGERRPMHTSSVALDLGGEWYALCMAGPTPRVWEQRDQNLRHLHAAAEAIRRARAV